MSLNLIDVFRGIEQVNKLVEIENDGEIPYEEEFRVESCHYGVMVFQGDELKYAGRADECFAYLCGVHDALMCWR